MVPIDISNGCTKIIKSHIMKQATNVRKKPISSNPNHDVLGSIQPAAPPIIPASKPIRSVNSPRTGNRASGCTISATTSTATTSAIAPLVGRSCGEAVVVADSDGVVSDGANSDSDRGVGDLGGSVVDIFDIAKVSNDYDILP